MAHHPEGSRLSAGTSTLSQEYQAANVLSRLSIEGMDDNLLKDGFLVLIVKHTSNAAAEVRHIFPIKARTITPTSAIENAMEQS